MNPGKPTSPVQGEVLSYAVRRRSEGAYWDVIAAELRTMTGKQITGPMVGAVVRRAGKVGFGESKPKVENEPLLGLSVSKGLGVNADTASDANSVQAVKDGGLATLRTAPAQAGATPNNLPAPVVHTSKTSAGNFVVIPDPQIPFHKRDALQFIERARRHFSVPKENMLCAGDEVDAYFGSRFDHSPDATHTPNSEIAAALDELKRWYAMWPYMRLANSNHGQRWVKKALKAQIPSQLMSGYREVLQAPEGWRWADSWTIDGGKSRFMLEHGHNGPQGFGGLRLRPLQNGLNTIWGHQHANAGIAHVVTAGQQVWGMCVGSLIDVESYAFEYDRANQYRPWIGVGVILNGGTTPLLVPYERSA